MSDAAPHLDLDALADALADVAEPTDTRHLAGCASCTSRLAELRAADARVVATLAALPAPPVPRDLAERLAAALAAEPPLAAPPRPAVVTALPEQRARRRAWVPAVAAGALLVTAGGLGLFLLGGPGGLAGGGDAAETASSAGAGGEGAGGSVLVQSSSGTDYADAAAVTAVLPDVLAGTAAPSELATSRAEDEPAPVAALPSAATVEDSAAAAAAPADLARLRSPEGLADCLAALLPPDEPDVQPLALDYASYSGRPALAVVLPDPDPAQLSVFVVGAGCSRANDSTLYFVRVPRP